MPATQHYPSDRDWCAPLLVVTPPQVCNAQLAVAAVRCGAIGLLDMGYEHDRGARHEALEALRQQAGDSAAWGVAWDLLGQPTRFPGCLKNVSDGLWPLLLLAGVDFQRHDLAAVLDQARQLASRVLVEAYSIDDALAAQEAGFDGVVLKGLEAGGRVGRQSAFLLAQQASRRLAIPYWVRGGIGPHAAAAAVLAGAAGVVLGEQLWLAKESPLDQAERAHWTQLDGSETVYVGDGRTGYRFFQRSARAALDDLARRQATGQEWIEPLHQRLMRSAGNGAEQSQPLIPAGEEIAFAAPLAREFVTVEGILSAFRRAMGEHLRQAKAQRALSADSPLARVHRTTYPVVQGPMTRVSNLAAFCDAVSNSGALPVLALALMRKAEVEDLLQATGERLADRSWGVGILGFVPAELRQEQLEVVCRVRPRFAVIAGGRPSQAAELEKAGIASYLHVPSPGLLELFIREGARKFVFEGRECGGHVGPRHSFTLWGQAIDVLLGADVDDASQFQILFAGGIHDRLSAAMVAAMAAPLVARGMKIGILVGTAYLFTLEAVSTGAITPEFQRQAVACRETALLESGVGHASRCAVTPFALEFAARKRELVASGAGADDVRYHLEMLNLGRLRLAAKGLKRVSGPGEAEKGGQLVAVSEEDQRREGMFMIGDVATHIDNLQTMAELHADLCQGSVEVLDQAAPRAEPQVAAAAAEAGQEPLAIVGMECLFPESNSLREYWHNILRKFSPVREIPADRWNAETFFSADRFDTNKAYSKWGAFLGEIPFDPLKYRIPPNCLASIEPVQLLALEVAWRALENAGFFERGFPRERTAVIFAASGSHDLSMAYGFRTLLRHHLAAMPEVPAETRQQILALLEAQLPGWTEDSFPGVLNNVIAGRISNHLDLGGTNFVVDAACASSLAALHIAVQQLRGRLCDVALIGSVDATNGPLGFMSFSRTFALSPRGKSCPFDDGADGIVLGEGVAALVLKRLADAERDGDRVYAVLRGMGTSSDGRSCSLTAPNPAGQLAALRHAYADAGVSPATVSLVEAHGTGTTVGDRVEMESLQQFLREAQAAPQSCAVGSVKSMIGHTKAAAGMAGLVKLAMALSEKVLPPTINVEVPNRKVDFAGGPVYVNTETRPWIRRHADQPRRAGISAFGFGGTNFHAVLEEYTGRSQAERRHVAPRAAELFFWSGRDQKDLAGQLQRLKRHLDETPLDDVAQLAFSTLVDDRGAAQGGDRQCRLAIVAGSIAELRKGIETALAEMPKAASLAHRSGVYCETQRNPAENRVCFLMPGQGAQQVNMLKDLLLLDPRGLQVLERADRLLESFFDRPLSSYVYPPPVFSDEDRARHKAELDLTSVAQPALSAVGLVALGLLRRFGLRPDCVAGHSHGEYMALHVAGCLEADDVVRLSALRGRAVARVCETCPGGMAAVFADPDVTTAALKWLDIPLRVANLNAPDHTIVAGPLEALERAIAELPKKKKLRVRRIPVTAAFHTPAVLPAAEELAPYLEQTVFHAPQIPVYSNATGELYPEDGAEIRRLIGRHFVEPVQFVREIEAIYQAGARVFLEVGPGSILTNYVTRILEGRPHVAIPLDMSGREGGVQLAHLLARSAALGLPVDLPEWFAGRGLRACTTEELFAAARQSAAGKTAWMVGPSRVRCVAPAGETKGGQAMPGPRQTAQPKSGEIKTPDVKAGDGQAGDGKPAKLPRASLAAAASGATAIAASGTEQIETINTGSSMDMIASNTPRHTRETSSVAQGPVVYDDSHLPSGVRPADGPAGHAAAAAPGAPAARPGLPVEAFAQFQENMASWLEMQKQYQRASERFLDLQEQGLRLLAGGAAIADGRPAAVFAPAAVAEAIPAALADRGVMSMPLRVAPAPILEEIAPTEGNGESLSGKAVAVQRSPESGPAPPADGQSGRRAPPAPAADPAPAAQAVAAEPGHVPTTDDFRRDLLEAASRRTGYPVEMLREDLLLEADLGIDSIKKIEILSGLKEHYMQVIASQDKSEEELLNEFAGMKTMRDIVGAYERARQESLAKAVGGRAEGESHAPSAVAVLEAPAEEEAAAAPEGPAPEEPADEEGPSMGVAERFVLRAVPRPLTVDFAAVRPFPKGYAMIMLGEIPGWNSAWSEPMFPGMNVTICAVVPGRETSRTEQSRFECDLGSPEAVKQLHEMIREDGHRVCGLVNILGVTEPFCTPGAINTDAALQLTTWLANLTKEFEEEILESVPQGGGRVFNLTTMGGKFGLDSRKALPLAQAGTMGFLKGLQKEWPGVRVKNIDVDIDSEPQQLLFALAAELVASDGAPEVGLNDQGRWELEVVEDPLAPERLQPAGLDANSVVLVTGGSYGLTAEVTKAMAERYRCRLVIVGRSPQPGEEGAHLRPLRDEQSLRNHFVGLASRNGHGAVPAEIDRQVRQVLREREIRETLAALAETGATVEYHACDVRDAARFGELIEDIYRRHGRIDGVVHGAGVIEDRRLRDKTPESLARVFRTKVDGAKVLCEKLRPGGLRFLIFFSSVAARFGNSQQADYCAANEYLNKLAEQLDAQWPSRVVSINWGLWDRGMVGPYVRQKMANAGLELMPTAEGVRALLAELEAAEYHATEVLLGCSIRRMAELSREGSV